MKSRNGTETSKKEPIIDVSYESDSIVYSKLVEVCYQQQPKFKKWIPFYGIVEVREVKVRAYIPFGLASRVLLTKSHFRLLSTKGESNRCRVHIYPLNMENIRGEAEETIATSEHPDYLETYGCYDGWHSDACPASMDYTAELCVAERIEAAQRRRNNLDAYYLLRDCVRDPSSADNYETLKGMAQESPIIYLKSVEFLSLR